MATYCDYPVSAGSTPDQLYRRIMALLVGATSLEVIPAGNTVVFRVWIGQHCDPAGHKKLDQ